MARKTVVAVLAGLLVAASCSNSDLTTTSQVAITSVTTTTDTFTETTSAVDADSTSEVTPEPTAVEPAATVPPTVPPTTATTTSTAPPPTTIDTRPPEQRCPSPADEGWFEVRQTVGDPDGDSVLDDIVTATRIAAEGQEGSGRDFQLCVELSSGGTRRTEFHSFLREGATRPVGSINVGDIGDTVFVALNRGASALILAEFAIVNDSLTEISLPDVNTPISVGGGLQHARGVTCSGPAPDRRFGLVVRIADAVHPLPDDFDDAIFARSEITYRREGNRFVVANDRTDEIRFNNWPGRFDWWQLVACPGIDPILR